MNNALEYDPRYGIPSDAEQQEMQRQARLERVWQQYEEVRSQAVAPVNTAPTEDEKSLYPF